LLIKKRIWISRPYGTEDIISQSDPGNELPGYYHPVPQGLIPCLLVFIRQRRETMTDFFKSPSFLVEFLKLSI